MDNYCNKCVLSRIFDNIQFACQYCRHISSRNEDNIILTKKQAMMVLCALSNSVIDKYVKEYNTDEQMDKLREYLCDSIDIIEKQVGIDLDNGTINVDTLEFER